MKKNYINPAVYVVELKNTVSLLSGSPKLGGNYSEGGEVLSRRGYDFDENEEDY